MANRFNLPLQTPVDATGAPYPGGKLFFYASGTTTKLNTYSDQGLTIANSNPVVLDSAGRYPNAIFLQNLPYKVVLAPSTDTDPPSAPIWTQDPVYTSDYSTIAQVQGVNGSPNGQIAGTAASATIPASMAWDYTNNILYICTTTGNSASAVWTAINASTAASVIPTPQGYLTPTSGTTVITGDVTAATAVYYTPFVGSLIPINSGSAFVPLSFTELSYTLTSNLVANNIYDLFVFNLNGVLQLGSGPSWSAGTGGSITAGSCARGTGAGGAALTLINGIYVNATSMTIRYGVGTTTQAVSAQQATYVGSLYIDGTNGQVSCYRTFGQSRKWGIWNAYNRQPVILKAGDNTSSWSVGGAGSVRAQNGNSANSLTTFQGLANDTIPYRLIQRASMTPNQNTGAVNGTLRNGIGYNSTSAFSGEYGEWAQNISNMPAAMVVIQTFPLVGQYVVPPALGINVATACEFLANSLSQTLYGTESGMALTAQWSA